ncbi:MAG: GGDEF domain-containing protein, partial [Alphaproteobacteria bacterium]|nr:GGDEF domain-containing protein [Alphaproteobacteria bacterium]
GFELALETAMARVKRLGECGVLVMIDLDGFKAINDTHGHQVGDLVLATVGTVLNRHTRFTDSAARIGGDEFALILTATDAKGAKLRVRKLDQILNCSSVPWNGIRIPIRASFGSVPYGPRDEADSLFAKADAAMYDRKRNKETPV